MAGPDKKPTFYDTLGISQDASPKDIKRAYQKLSMQYHPDKTQGDTEKQEKFKEISEAYGVLKDPEKQKIYNKIISELSEDQFKEVVGKDKISNIVEMVYEEQMTPQKGLDKLEKSELAALARSGLGAKFDKKEQKQRVNEYKDIVAKSEDGSLKNHLDNLLKENPSKYRQVMANAMTQSISSVSKGVSAESHGAMLTELMGIYKGNQKEPGGNFTSTEWNRVKPHIINAKESEGLTPQQESILKSAKKELHTAHKERFSAPQTTLTPSATPRVPAKGKGKGKGSMERG